MSEEDKMPIDIPIDLPIEVAIQQSNDTWEEDLSVNTRRLYERFDPLNIRSLLKDVGMTVPKSRETSAVYSYMQQDRG